jgi:alpha-glucosidase
VLIGETYVLDPTQLGSFYGNDDELNLAFNFTLLHSKLRAADLRTSIEQAERYLPDNAWPVWTGGNHDNHRFPSRWAGEDPAKTRAAMMMLMGLRGTPFLYYGDEIGMPDTEIPDGRVLDPVGVFHGARVGRDPERTPMPWTGNPGAGYTEAGVEPWLPFGDVAACNVADQRHDPDSMLSLTRDLIGLRDAMPELRRGAYTTLASSDDRLWAWQRGDHTVVAMNCSDEAVDVPDAGAGTIRMSTIRARDNERVGGTLHLEPWEAAIVWRDA